MGSWQRMGTEVAAQGPCQPSSFQILLPVMRHRDQCARVCVYTRAWGTYTHRDTCIHIKIPTPPPMCKSGPRRGPLFRISLAQKNGCDSTKPRLNRRRADCLVTVTNDLMWKRQDQMCAEQRRLGAPPCQTMAPGRQVAPRSSGQNMPMEHGAGPSSGSGPGPGHVHQQRTHVSPA